MIEHGTRLVPSALELLAGALHYFNEGFLPPDVQSGIVHLNKANRGDPASLYFTLQTCGMHQQQQQQHGRFGRRTGWWSAILRGMNMQPSSRPS
jgi:hypothetical protein